ncbi:TolC family protein, partial [Candidatus Poribacteria bacterium]|nr:TolC family protein [Candidatus Poribacteria bacterium]
ATAAFEAAKIRVTAAVMDAAYGTRGAFYRFQADQQMLEMFQQVALATGAAYEFAQQLYEAGNIPEVDLLLQKASSGQAKLSLAAAEVALAESRERLNAWLGLWGEDTAWTVEARLPDVPADMMAMENLEKRAIENSINLALARQEIVSIGQRLGLLNATQLVPRLDVSAEIEREEREWEAGPGLGVEIPLFDRNQGNRAATRAELRRLKLEYYALAVEIRAAVRAAQRRLLTARQTALFYRDEVLPLQGKIVEQTQLQYNAMQVGAFRLLQAKQQEIDAGRGYIQSLYNYHIAQAELEQILNGRLVARTSTTQLMVSGTSESSLTPEEGAH